MLTLGLLGYALQKMDYPLAAVLLGFILGPIIELNYCRGMQRAMNHFERFFTDSPIAIAIYLVTIIIVLVKIKAIIRKNKKSSYPIDNN